MFKNFFVSPQVVCYFHWIEEQGQHYYSDKRCNFFIQNEKYFSLSNFLHGLNHLLLQGYLQLSILSWKVYSPPYLLKINPYPFQLIWPFKSGLKLLLVNGDSTWVACVVPIPIIPHFPSHHASVSTQRQWI